MNFRSVLRPALALAPAALLGASTTAQTLAEYDPVGAQSAAMPLSAVNTAPGVVATEMFQVGFGGWANTNVWPVGKIGTASPTIDLNQYLSFEVSAPGDMTFTELTYSRQSYVDEGNRAAAVRTSLDGFAADVAVLTGLSPSGYVEHVFDLTGLAPSAGPVEFRVYFYDAPGTGDDWVDLLSTATVNGSGLVLSGEVSDAVGVNYCAANPNSTGVAAVAGARGSLTAADNSITLETDGLPSFSFAFFIVSRTQGFATNPGGSSGNLCLQGAIGRFVGPGQVQQAGTAGHIELPIDLTQIPQPLGFESVLPGDSWNFQTWYRDSTGGGAPTSNFSDGIELTFV